MHTLDSLVKKKTIKAYIDEISSHIDNVEDPNVLDRALVLLTQTSTVIKASESPEYTHLKSFDKKDKFSPTQKNETQLHFKKTVGNSGRKKQTVIMRYSAV